MLAILLTMVSLQQTITEIKTNSQEAKIEPGKIDRNDKMTAGRSVNSSSFDWGTPPKYIAAVQDMLGLQVGLDPCSNRWSLVDAKTVYSLPEYDGLREGWDFETIYVNPPYGADRSRRTTIKDWLKKCAQANREFGSQVLALVPVASNTSHWKECIWGQATAVCFLYDTRLKFLENGLGGGKGAPMACAMIYWGHDYGKFRSIFTKFGAVVDIRSLQLASAGKNGQAQ